MILTPPNQTRLGGNHNIFYLYSVRYIVVLHNHTFQDQTSYLQVILYQQLAC
jgi:hypothetical protein